MKEQREERIVRQIWTVFEKETLCDKYGGAEYQRCRPLVIDFVKKLIQACNPGAQGKEGRRLV